MSKTSTTTKELRTDLAALTENEPCDLLFQSQLLNDLSDEFEGESFSPDRSVVDRVLAYSRSVEVNRSTIMKDDSVVVKN